MLAERMVDRTKWAVSKSGASHLQAGELRWQGACGGGANKVSASQVSPTPFCLFGLTAAGWKQETAADTLLIQNLFGKPCSGPSYGRIWLQLDEFYRTASPFSATLSKFPSLFWMLPPPFDTVISRMEWRHRLEVSRIFLHLIKDGKSTEMESAMIAFFWPEIQKNPSLLDIVSTAKISLSRRDRIKRLISALLCLHFLSLPSIHMGAEALSSRPASHMPTCIFLLLCCAVPSLDSLQLDRPKREDCKGHSSGSPPGSQ